MLAKDYMTKTVVTVHPILNLDDSDVSEVLDALTGLGFDIQSVDEVE